MDIYKVFEESKRCFHVDNDGEMLLCPLCDSSNITEEGNWWECNVCKHEWREE